jgi:GT2 family glycosyltransferase
MSDGAALPRCSIVVPTWERPDRLAQCLGALARLDYPRERFEVIVVDDGGRACLDAVVARHRDRVEATVVRVPHAGPAAARNAGVARAQGTLLAFTDDDCRPEPGWLAALARRAQAAPGHALGGRTLNALGRDLYASLAQLIIDVGYAHNNREPDRARFFTTNNLAVPVDVFRAVGGFDPSFRTSEDRDLCDRLVAHGVPLSYVPDAVVQHAHPLGFARFCWRHFTYGQGAYRFHRASARRWHRRVRVEPAFYVALHRRPFRQERLGRAVAMTALLGVWHVANAAGFAWEALRMRTGRA